MQKMPEDRWRALNEMFRHNGLGTPDQDGVLRLKCEHQLDVVIHGGRTDFCFVVWERDGVIRRSLSWQEVEKIRKAKDIASLPCGEVPHFGGMLTRAAKRKMAAVCFHKDMKQAGVDRG